MMERRMGMWIAAAAIAGCISSQALADVNCDPTNNGFVTATDCEVSISGATLLEPLEISPAGTNDFIDVDGDNVFGFSPSFPFTDQLANTLTNGGDNITSEMRVHIRSVGSINGYNEFIDFQLCGDIPTTIPSETGLLNRFEWAAEGATLWGGPFADASGTPQTPEGIDLAILDVPGSFGTAVAGSGTWNNTPVAPGYGLNPVPSNSGFISQLQFLERDCDGPGGNPPVFLNQNTGAPDANTIFDNTVAWAPIVYIANVGTCLEDVCMTQLQMLFTTGRMPNGENLQAGPRDVGSGTRNGMMNSSGIDPAWGRGDNQGKKESVTEAFIVGPDTQSGNCGGSSLLEAGVQNHRLGVGYTGLVGGSRAAVDAASGKYEILNVKFDDRGGTQFVRPSVDSVLDNADPDSAYQLGGLATFVSRGNPAQSSAAAPDFMPNQAAAGYLNNINDSVAAFASVPTDDDNLFMPGEFLALNYFPVAGIDAVPQLLDPDNFVAQTVNQPLQEVVRNENTTVVEAYGFANDANRTPVRQQNPGFPGDPVKNPGYPADPNPNMYSDAQGVLSTGYVYPDGANWNIVEGDEDLSAENAKTGDMNDDGARDLLDADELVQAYYQPRNNHRNGAGSTGDMTVDVSIPEVIADFNHDGDLSKEDLRYWMDGLAIDPNTDKLDRKAGAIAIDTAILAHGPATDNLSNPVADSRDWLPWADSRRRILIPQAPIAGVCQNPLFSLPTSIDSMIATGKGYALGDFRGDVAGMDMDYRRPTAGGPPLGWDGIIDLKDVDYVAQMLQAGDYSTLEQALFSDLSADMNGDCLVTKADVTELVTVILKTAIGDLDLDCDVDADDLAILQGNLGTGTLYSQGDLDCDGDVDADDEALLVIVEPALVSAVSRKLHGGTDDYDIELYPNPAGTAGAGVESREGGIERLVLTFDAPVSIDCSNIQVNQGTDSCDSVTDLGGNAYEVALSGGSDDSCVEIEIVSLSLSSVSVIQGLNIKGDVNASGGVTVIDLSEAKTDITGGTNGTVVAGNAQKDVELSNGLTVIDLSEIKAQVGGSATCP